MKPKMLFLKKRIFCFFSLAILAFSPTGLLADSYEIRGRVVDAKTHEPLAFVNIIIEGTHSGGISDIDGFFELSSHSPIQRIVLSYVGYQQKTFEVDPSHALQWVGMDRKPIELTVVEVFPGKNPAHRIIENAFLFRNRNNPEKLGAFTYESYNKFVFTGEFEPSESENPIPAQVDTLTKRLRNFLDNHHLMIMETVTERRFRFPNRNNETVLASRISGFESPVLALIATQFQSFSFYEDYITVSGKDYLSPLSPGSTSRYFFLLEDTTYTANDTVFILSFRPSKGRNFDGLRGVLYINSNGWAIQNVIAEPANQSGKQKVRIQQKYELIDNRQWFPTQLNTDVEIVNVPNINHFKLLGLGRTYLRNIVLEPHLRRKDFSAYAVEFSPKTIVRDPDFWNSYRTDSLSPREENTYFYLDSIGARENLDHRLDLIETLMSGALRTGFADIEIKHLLGYNDQEGWRPGFGLRSNNKLSKRFSLHGNLGYGLKSKTLRYGYGGELLIDRLSDLRLGYDFFWDFTERGGSRFLETGSLLSPYRIRSYFLRDMDMLRRHRLWIGWRTLRNQLSILTYASNEDQTANPAYQYAPKATLAEFPANRFRFFETGLMMRLAFGEQYVLTPTKALPFGKDRPIIYFNLAKGWDGVHKGQYNYLKTEIKFEKRLRLRLVGSQQWVLEAGLVNGQVPWPKLFTGKASYRRFAVTAPQSFATMHMAEFVSDRYVSLFFYHNFEKLLLNRPGFSPGLILLTNIGFGSLRHPGWHQGYEIKTPEKGFFESGLAITDLMGSGISSLGLEFMYRYGPYALPKFSENFSLRLTYSILFR